MSLFKSLPDDAIFVRRDDAHHLLSAWSRHSFDLEDRSWPSVEHYFQAMKFHDPDLREKIRLAPHPKLAQKTARWHFWKVRRDWKKIQVVVMTRGIYLKCRTHPEVAEALLDTGDKALVENSLYDHYWGCGRDQRGHNYYGKVLMDVREKLRSEALQSA